MRYILFLKKLGVPPLLSSLTFGSIFFVFAIFFYIFQEMPLSFGYFSCLSWLFIGPFLIYKAGQIVDALWPDMLEILDEKQIERLQSREKKFHSYGYLVIGTPAAVIVAVLILLSRTLLKSVSLEFTIFYFASWIVLSLLGSIGVWGVIHLMMLVWDVRKVDLKLNPLSHTRFGGMEFLADFGIKGTVMYSTGALMIPMAMEIAMRNELYQEILPYAIVGSGFFALTILLSFLVQLFALNRAAVGGRRKILVKTGKQYQILLKEYEKNRNLETGVRILVIQSLFDEAYQLRVYPWDVGVLLKLAGSMALPLITGTIRLWFPWIPIP